MPRKSNTNRRGVFCGDNVQLCNSIEALLDLNDDGAVSHPVPGMAVTLLEAARLRLLEAEADGARYRWLRDISVPPHNFYISVPDEFAGVNYQRDEVDGYIDAARAAFGGKHPL